MPDSKGDEPDPVSIAEQGTEKAHMANLDDFPESAPPPQTHEKGRLPARASRPDRLPYIVSKAN